MRMKNWIEGSCRGNLMTRWICWVMIGCLTVVPGMYPANGVETCSQPSAIGGQRSSCSCSGGAGYASGCGSGIDIDPYESCYGGFKQGYEICLNRRQPVGKRWDCAMTATWSKITACTAQAAVCAVACGSSAAHAGVLCAACIANYVANCMGCGFVSCVKKNERTVERSRKTVTTGACPKSVNTGR